MVSYTFRWYYHKVLGKSLQRAGTKGLVRRIVYNINLLIYTKHSGALTFDRSFDRGVQTEFTNKFVLMWPTANFAMLRLHVCHKHLILGPVLLRPINVHIHSLNGFFPYSCLLNNCNLISRSLIDFSGQGSYCYTFTRITRSQRTKFSFIKTSKNCLSCSYIRI